MSEPRRALPGPAVDGFDDATLGEQPAPVARRAAVDATYYEDFADDAYERTGFFRTRGARILVPGVAAAVLASGVAIAANLNGGDDSQMAVPADISAARDTERPTRSDDRPTPSAAASATPKAQSSASATPKALPSPSVTPQKGLTFTPKPEPSATQTSEASASATSSSSSSADSESTPDSEQTSSSSSSATSSSSSPSSSSSSSSKKSSTSSSKSASSSKSSSSKSSSSKSSSSKSSSSSSKKSSGSGSGSVANCAKPTGGFPNGARAVYEASCRNFPDITSYGGVRAGDPGNHGTGQALDIMVSGQRGWQIAEYMRANASSLGVTEVIYEQKIWTTQRSSEGWRSMSDRGSATANHYDHVHVSTG